MAKDANAFADWLADKPAAGERYEYYRGYLAFDRYPKDDPRVADAGEVGDYAWKRYLEGRVCLTQQKHALGDYSYFATAR